MPTNQPTKTPAEFFNVDATNCCQAGQHGPCMTLMLERNCMASSRVPWPPQAPVLVRYLPPAAPLLLLWRTTARTSRAQRVPTSTSTSTAKEGAHGARLRVRASMHVRCTREPCNWQKVLGHTYVRPTTGQVASLRAYGLPMPDTASWPGGGLHLWQTAVAMATGSRFDQRSSPRLLPRVSNCTFPARHDHLGAG